jgi:hypothetical protein
MEQSAYNRGWTYLFVCVSWALVWVMSSHGTFCNVCGRWACRFHRLAVPWLADSVGGIFVCAWIPKGSFLCFFYMVVLVLVYHLLFRTRVFCLGCVLRMLKPGYFDVAYMFFIPYCYRPAWLPYICSIACIAFSYTPLGFVLSDFRASCRYMVLLVYGVVGMWCCGYVVLWVYGVVGIWCCRYVVLWVYGIVGIWCCRYVVLSVYGVVRIWCCRYVVVLAPKALLTLRRLMSYIYGAPILDVSRSHTTTQHSR